MGNVHTSIAVPPPMEASARAELLGPSWASVGPASRARASLNPTSARIRMCGRSCCLSVAPRSDPTRWPRRSVMRARPLLTRNSVRYRYTHPRRGGKPKRDQLHRTFIGKSHGRVTPDTLRALHGPTRGRSDLPGSARDPRRDGGSTPPTPRGPPARLPAPSCPTTPAKRRSRAKARRHVTPRSPRPSRTRPIRPRWQRMRRARSSAGCSTCRCRRCRSSTR
jgi:hypothetical protein